MLFLYHNMWSCEKRDNKLKKLTRRELILRDLTGCS